MTEALYVIALMITIMFIGGFVIANILSWGFPELSVLDRYMIGLIIVGICGAIFFFVDGDQFLANSATGIAIFGLSVRSFMLWIKTTPAYLDFDREQRMKQHERREY